MIRLGQNKRLVDTIWILFFLKRRVTVFVITYLITCVHMYEWCHFWPGWLSDVMHTIIHIICPNTKPRSFWLKTNFSKISFQANRPWCNEPGKALREIARCPKQTKSFYAWMMFVSNWMSYSINVKISILFNLVIFDRLCRRDTQHLKYLKGILQRPLPKSNMYQDIWLRSKVCRREIIDELCEHKICSCYKVIIVI